MSVPLLLIMIHFSFILRVGDNRQSGLPNVCDPSYCGGIFPTSSLLLHTRVCSGLHLLQRRREFFISRCSCTTALLRGKYREELCFGGITSSDGLGFGAAGICHLQRRNSKVGTQCREGKRHLKKDLARCTLSLF